MRIEVHHYNHSDAETLEKLNEILSILQDLRREEVKEIMDLTILKEKVTKIETVGDSMKATMTGLAETLAASKNDPAAIQAVADELSAKADEWATAVTANTSAIPETAA